MPHGSYTHYNTSFPAENEEKSIRGGIRTCNGREQRALASLWSAALKLGAVKLILLCGLWLALEYLQRKQKVKDPRILYNQVFFGENQLLPARNDPANKMI